MWEEQLKRYDEIIEKCPKFKRLGKTMPYTGANGYMFTLLNKAGEIGVRFSEEVKKKYIKEFNTTIYKSYGATMRGYILIPDDMLSNKTELVIKLFNESYDYVMSLEPK